MSEDIATIGQALHASGLIDSQIGSGSNAYQALLACITQSAAQSSGAQSATTEPASKLEQTQELKICNEHRANGRGSPESQLSVCACELLHAITSLCNTLSHHQAEDADADIVNALHMANIEALSHQVGYRDLCSETLRCCL